MRMLFTYLGIEGWHGVSVEDWAFGGFSTR
jgi:hypothetical protein